MPARSTFGRLGRGFTIMELAVVLVILLLLFVILFPLLARSNRHHDQVSCAMHEKQLVLAMLSYAEDYDSRLPPVAGVWNESGTIQPVNWTGDRIPRGEEPWRRHGMVEPYVKMVGSFRCPQVRHGWLTYRYNDLAATASLTKDFAVLERSVVLMDGDEGVLNAGHGAPGDDPVLDCAPRADGRCYAATGTPVSVSAATRHEGEATYAFADGHIKRLKREQIFFPPAVSPKRDHGRGEPDPAGTMTVGGGRKYAATFHLR
jgi:prepilin-type processing-associated H-X9-DG protein